MPAKAFLRAILKPSVVVLSHCDFSLKNSHNRVLGWVLMLLIVCSPLSQANADEFVGIPDDAFAGKARWGFARVAIATQVTFYAMNAMPYGKRPT